MQAEIPETVWEDVRDFCQLVHGRSDDVLRGVLAFLEFDKREPYPETEAANLARSVARLVVATQRLSDSDSKRRLDLDGITPMLSRLDLSLDDEITLATLILGEWPLEAPAIGSALEVVKAQWEPATQEKDVSEISRYAAEAGIKAFQEQEKERRRKIGRRHGAKGGCNPKENPEYLRTAVDHALKLVDAHGKKHACELACREYDLSIVWQTLQYHLNRRLEKGKRERMKK